MYDFSTYKLNVHIFKMYKMQLDVHIILLMSTKYITIIITFNII